MSVKGPLLALINRAPAYGYELHTLLGSVLGEPWSINIGQIYSTLSRLERDGFIKQSNEGEARESDRTIYEITESGREELTSWLREPVSRHDRLRDSFFAKFLLNLQYDYVPIEEAIQSQRRRLLSEMHDLIQNRTKVDPKTKLPWLLILEFAIMHLEADLRWLELSEAHLEELLQMRPPQFAGRARGRPPESRSD